MTPSRTPRATTRWPPTGVLVVRHTPHEDAVDTALRAAGLPLRTCRTWAGDPLPDSPAGLMALVVPGGPQRSYDDLPHRSAESALVRAALEAEVPVLGVGSGARSLTVAAGGAAGAGAFAGRGCGGEVGWEDVRATPAASDDPLFAGLPARLRVPYRPAGAVDLPAGATVLASGPLRPVGAFRIGRSAWGLGFEPEPDKTALDSPTATVTAADLEELARFRDTLFARFAALVATRAQATTTRAFFTSRAATWEERFAVDTPRYAEAVSRMQLRPGQRALDVGCGSGRAMDALRDAVGASGVVLGADLTPAMLTAAARLGRTGLLLADAFRLPLPAGVLDGVFSAGLVDHVPEPAAALREWARVTSPGGVLLLYHPSGRAERAARHGRALDPADPLAEANLRPALDTAGWDLTRYEDAARHFLARAVRRKGAG